jgi:predicted transcriptional regulator
MNVLLSIKPEFADKILSGEKRFEFRRVMPKRDVERIVVYASSPVCRIVGEFTVRGVVTASPRGLWRLTRAHAGIPKHYFDAYFRGKEEAHAFEVGEAQGYDEPIDPRKIDPAFRAPQSFVYLDSLAQLERGLRSA